MIEHIELSVFEARVYRVSKEQGLLRTIKVFLHAFQESNINAAKENAEEYIQTEVAYAQAIDDNH